jgi:catechol 2,3-dioxygenase-like lactoylglutathione lyase family enzyme
MPAGGEDRAREFYEGVLGISEIPKPLHLAKRGGCWFERGDLKIHLGVRALAEKLRSQGYVLDEGEPLEGYQRIYVDDPFGNRIELMEPLVGPEGR